MNTLGSTVAFTVLILLYVGYMTHCGPSSRFRAIGDRHDTITSNPSALTYDAQITLSPNISNITCLKPRVRVEWRALTTIQKESWIKAVKCLAKLPSANNINPGPIRIRHVIPYNKSASLYDDFTYVHEALRDHIHQTGFFLPWHRYYLWHFSETLMQRCNYTGPAPYWNWTMDTEDFDHSYLLNNSDPNTGFGNFGDKEHQHAVIDGAFANFSLAYPYPHILRRQFFPYPWFDLQPPLFLNPKINATEVITFAEIHKTITGYRDDFRGFQTYFERMQGPHMSIHYALGGDIGGYCIAGAPFCINPSLRDPGTSPNDPLFWLHHGMIDKIWHDWQHFHKENMYAFEGGSIRQLRTWPKYPVGAPPDLTPNSILPSLGFLPDNLTIKDMFDTMNSLPCYTYE